MEYLFRYRGRNIIVFFPSIAVLTSSFPAILSRFNGAKEMKKIRIYQIHSTLAEDVRNGVMSEFNSKGGIIFATDVLAQGIDSPGVSVVIHYHSPKSVEEWMQKAGRSRGEGYDVVIAGSDKQVLQISDSCLRTTLQSGCVVERVRAYLHGDAFQSDARCAQCSRCVPDLAASVPPEPPVEKRAEKTVPRINIVQTLPSQRRAINLKAVFESSTDRLPSFRERLKRAVEKFAAADPERLPSTFYLDSSMLDAICDNHCVSTQDMLQIGVEPEVAPAIVNAIQNWLKELTPGLSQGHQ